MMCDPTPVARQYIRMVRNMSMIIPDAVSEDDVTEAPGSSPIAPIVGVFGVI